MIRRDTAVRLFILAASSCAFVALLVWLRLHPFFNR